MIQDDIALSLFDASNRLGVSPSAIKKRVAQLNLPVQRGARGKLIFDRHAYGLLLQADELLKQGFGFDECRRRLGLDAPVRKPLLVFGRLLGEGPEAVVNSGYVEPAAEEAAEAAETLVAPNAEPAAQAVETSFAPGAEPASPPDVPQAVRAPEDDGKLRRLPPPVFIQLGKGRKQPAPSPDLIARLDSALRLLEEKDRHNQMLQAKLLVAYDEMTKLSATAAAFQERSLNLAHEVQKLQGEVKMLSAPVGRRPWWKFWG